MVRIGLIFGVVVAATISFWIWGQYAIMTHSLSTEVFAFIIGGIFLAFGVFLGLKIRNQKVNEVQPSPSPSSSPILSSSETQAWGLSPREMEVLSFMAEGLTNQQIADRLFVSLNTVKTHTANLYVKLAVPNRTAAVAKAKANGILV